MNTRRKSKGIIWFNVKEALDFLLEKGLVYTMRPNKKEEGMVTIMTSVGGKRRKVGKGFLRLIGEFESTEQLLEESEHLLPFTGFKTLEEWKDHASEGSRFLYRVDLLEKYG
ncbi:hypothetical protein DRN43_00670 [Thermococci archaeon]|nr:MAG: hypothetical protein DRN43_00670 [Thermococci archaeon]RLG47799.1 MAG: hypothetical protein DRN90_04400 [Candidatus Korarchaeota archaeon]